MLESLIIAFSTFSRIPMPRREWTKEGMKYSVCFLPCIGIVIGLLEWAALLFLDLLGAGDVLRGCVFAALPLIITGGIHMDGYLDTNDALRSWRSREEKLEILKDPHVGAFAVIYGLLYILLETGFASQLPPAGERVTAAVCAAFTFSRSLSGYAVVAFPKAKKDGMLRTAADASPKGVRTVMVLEMCAAAAVMVLISPLFGAAEVCAGLLMLFIYHHVAMKVFGGTTGDLAGWFIELAELLMLAAAVVLTLVAGVR